jgi:hypothetical protein
MEEDDLVVISRTKMAIIFIEIINYINRYLSNPTYQIHDKFNIETFISKLHKNERFVSVNEYTNEEESIFTLTKNGDNLLIYCCKKKIPEVCNYLIEVYCNRFNVGEINNMKETALIISIKNNMFDVASNLILSKYSDDCGEANIGQIDINNKSALDYMLEKVKVDENDKIQVGDNDIIVKNKDLIVDMLNFYLDTLKHSIILIRPGEYGTVHRYGIVENYFEIICKDLYFWKPLLEETLKHRNTLIKFTKSFCKGKKQAKSAYNIGKIVTRNRRQKQMNIPTATQLLNVSHEDAQPLLNSIDLEILNNQSSELLPLRNIDEYKRDYGELFRERNPIHDPRLPVYYPSIPRNKKRVLSPESEKTRRIRISNINSDIDPEFRLGGKTRNKKRKTRKNKTRRMKINKRLK